MTAFYVRATREGDFEVVERVTGRVVKLTSSEVQARTNAKSRNSDLETSERAAS